MSIYRFPKQPPQDPEPLVLTPPEAAKALGISVSTLARLTKQGRIPCRRISRRLIRYSIEDIRAVANGTDAASKAGAA